MSKALEQFYKVTAINAWDLAYDGMRPNRVAVGYCPVEIDNYTPKLVEIESVSTEQDKYIEKAIKFTKEQLEEYKQFIDVSVESAVNIVVDSIKAGWNDIMEKGHTVGLMAEVTAAYGAGVVGGFFWAFDKTGRSFIGFAGLAAGAVVEVALIGGGFFYAGPREGIEGWGGEVNASAALGLGVEWEAMFTGGNSGHVIAGTAGLGIALSVEFQYAWLISESVD
ncbi:MAG: hypothetical protein KTR20_12340 [Cellvibrionaceae bacterium]|nr:hypothetical protein [Cellvibrionaceae bacterium]